MHLFGELLKRIGPAADASGGTGKGRKASSGHKRTYDRETQKPVLKCSICNGEQVAGFKDLRTGKFEEVALIRNAQELDDFMKLYGIDAISKEY